MPLADILKRNAADKAAGVEHVHPEHAGKARAVEPPAPPAEVEPCGYAERVSGFRKVELGLAADKDWKRCAHPAKPLGGREYVCPCDGCGPSCSGYDPDADPDAPPAAPFGIAPLAGWEGAPGRKPWEYALTVAIPHLNTPDQLKLALALWRAQTVRPYLVVVDTGSPRDVLGALEAEVRAPDCEVHYVRAHAYRHPSAAVTVALDLAQSLCRTEVLVHTHADVFPRRRDFAAFLLDKVSAASPVVGWRMSPRDGAAAREWRDCVSHTATALHMPTARQKALWWTMERWYDARGRGTPDGYGWPDTESPFLLAMRAGGVSPLFLGEEKNLERHDLVHGGVAWADHARSYTGLKMMAESDPNRAAAEKYMGDAEREARERLEAWRAER